MIPGPRSLRAAAVGSALAVAAACSPAQSAAPTVRPSPTGIDAAGIALRAEVVGGGFRAPILVTNAGDGSGRLFVVEQAGRARIVRDGRLMATPFLDLTGRISSGGERGLLGLAFHPSFPDDPRAFVDYTGPGRERTRPPGAGAPARIGPFDQFVRRG